MPEAVECAWKELFDDGERKSLDEGFIVTGFLSIGLGLWLNLSILMTDLVLDRSYRNLANFTAVAYLRRVMPLIGYFSALSFPQSSDFDLKRCEAFAFLETFLAILEIEWLTSVCIERYIVAKYAKNGWMVLPYHYVLLQCSCIFFVSLYSFPPLIGIGQYGLDFSCSFCSFDVILTKSWTRYIVMAIFMLRSVKPVLFIFGMITWARILEKTLVRSEQTKEQEKFTKNMILMTVVYLICWSPLALIRGSVVLSQLMYSDPVVPVSASYIKWTMLAEWVSFAVVALTLFAADNKIRNKMFNLNYSHEADKKEV